MQRELRHCIATAQQILADLGAVPPCPPSSRPQPSELAQLRVIASSGIPILNHPRLPAPLAVKLHTVTQEHFQVSCLALQNRDSQPGMPSLRDVALKLRDTYVRIYERKIASVVSTITRNSAPTEKQPWATDVLLYAFEQSQTPTKRERHQLASLTGMTLEQVRVWFQNRRQRTKKRAPELQPRSTLQLTDVLERVVAYRKAAEDDFEDDKDSGYCSNSEPEYARTSTWGFTQKSTVLTVPSTTPRSYPTPYIRRELSTEFHCDPPVFLRTAATHPPVHVEVTSISELARSMSRLTLRHRRQTPRSSSGSSTSTVNVVTTGKSNGRGEKAVASASNSTAFNGDGTARKKVTRKDPETGRKVAGRRTPSTASSISPAPSSSTSPPTATTLSVASDTPTKPRKRLGPLRRTPAGKAPARQASSSSVASTSSSDSSRSASYSSDFSLASDSSFTSVESVPTAASVECFQPQQQPQFDPLAAFDFTQLFSSQPSDILPQPVADFDLPPDLLAGLHMPMDTAALPPPESTDFLALLNDPTIQDLLQSVQDMDVVAPQQTQESLTFNNTLDVGSVDTSGFLDLSASTLPTFDAMFGLDASSFQDILWNSPGFSLPITV